MKFNYLKTENEFKLWDAFLMDSPRGHYAQLSTWLDSYKAYGAKKQIIIQKEEGEIVGGIGLVIFGKGPFKLVTLPMGPIVKEGFEHLIIPLVKEGVEFSKQIGALLFQMKNPYKEGFFSPFMIPKLELPQDLSFEKGFPFKVVVAPNILLLVNLHKDKEMNEEWEEVMLKSFKANTRRDIRKSMRNGLEFIEAKTIEVVQAAYEIIEKNGAEQGHSVRSWKEFGPTLLEQVHRKQAVVMTVKKDGELLGAHYGVIAGKRYSYSMGGTRRIETDYRVGHFLHWHVIKRAKELGLISYDFTSLGSPGVLRFKQGFQPELIEFDASHYVILSKPKFFVFNKLFPYMKKHKAKFAKVANVLLGKK